MICSTVLSVMVILASGAEMFVSFIVDYDLVIKKIRLSDFYLDTGFKQMIKSRMRVHV